MSAGASSQDADARPGFGSDLYVGLVRAIGTDLSDAIAALRICFRRAGYPPNNFHVIKFSGFFQELLDNVAKRERLAEAPVRLSSEAEGRFRYYTSRMDAGDWLRTQLSADVLALRAIAEIRSLRPRAGGPRPHRGSIFVFDSLMHPAEVSLLRSVYGRRLFLVAVHSTAQHRAQRLFDELRSSDPDAKLAIRETTPGNADDEDRQARRLSATLRTKWERQVDLLMKRDEGLAEPDETLSPAPPERRVAVRRTFSEADVFVTLKEASDARSSKRLGVVERFVDKLFNEPFHTPTRAELGMAHAYVASRRSGSLARAVGAAICTAQGELISVGVNDVPAPGGGHYWPFYDGGGEDHRDHLYEWRLPSGQAVKGVDSNDQIKLEIFFDLLERVFAAMPPHLLEDPNQRTLFGEMKFDPRRVVNTLFHDDLVRASRFFDVIEYSRTVHAEMSALLSCARRGVSTTDAILYCTTFPCHECSRHIIASGISRVVYVEPYSKSRVGSLHTDAVIVERFTGPPPLVDREAVDNGDGRRVSFEPFIGIAPTRHDDLYSIVTRKIDGPVSDATYLGRTRHWELGPESPLRSSIVPESAIARMGEDIMIDTCEEYIEETLAKSQLIRIGSAERRSSSRAGKSGQV